MVYISSMRKMKLECCYMSQYKIHNLENIKNVIIKIISDIKKEMTLDDESFFNIRLVLSELLNNSLEHTSTKDSVNIDFEIDQNCSYIKFVIEDSGSGFDYSTIDETHVRNNLFDNRGRGLVIVHGLCEKVQYNYLGNTISVVMKI